MGLYKIKAKADDVYLIPGDMHFPIHDEEAIACMQEWFEGAYPTEAAYKRGVILQGDTVDTHSVSRHQRKAARLASFPRLVDEAAMAIPFLEWAGAQAHGCVYLPGNHEDWVTDLVDNEPGLSGAPGLDWPNLTGLGAVDGVEFVPYGSWIVLGKKLVVLHGDGLPARPEYMTRKFPDQVTIYGHTHQLGAHFQTVYEPDGSAGVRGAINVGHMSVAAKHEYAQYPNWQQGFATVEFFGDNGGGEPFFRVNLHQVLRTTKGKCVVA